MPFGPIGENSDGQVLEEVKKCLLLKEPVSKSKLHCARDLTDRNRILRVGMSQYIIVRWREWDESGEEELPLSFASLTSGCWRKTLCRSTPFKPISGKECWKFRLSRQQPLFSDCQMEDILSQHLSMLEENSSHLTNH